MGIISVLSFAGGNVFIFVKISTLHTLIFIIGNFNQDTAEFWRDCNCPTFYFNYHRSINFYTYSAVVCFCFAVLQLIMSIICYFKLKREQPHP